MIDTDPIDLGSNRGSTFVWRLPRCSDIASMRRSIVEWSAASDLEPVLDGLPSIPTGTSDQVLATALLARMLAAGAV
eukprot:14350461-Alexandrium_andersonii.AAC.1